MAANQSITITLNQQRYHIQSTGIALSSFVKRKIHNFDVDFIPATAIPWSKPVFNESDLRQVSREYNTEDDVWTVNFLALIVILQPSRSKVDARGKNVLLIDNSKAGLPKGPLFIEKSTGSFFKVFKLVPDTHYAFISAVIPMGKPAGKPAKQRKMPFKELSNNDQIEIALPSRLYFVKSDSKPFAGLRIAVKDTIAMKGLRTGYGSKAWVETYGPEKKTAPCVQLLLDAGAIIVGKVKTSEFAEGVDPADWTEGVCPINPRGDGEQKPSSSSTGSASAVAAYEWLDVSYGTDTGGSIRHPAGVQGLFGQRPSHGKIDTTGVLGATPLFNTVGIFARSTKVFTEVGSYLVEPKQGVKVQDQGHRYNLLYPTRAPSGMNRDPFHNNQLRWFPHPEVEHSAYSEVEKLIEGVVSQIEEELNCTRHAFNLDELWRATHPIGQPRSIDEATGFIYGVITTASACQTGIDQFLVDYAAANDGKEAPMSAMVKRRFEYGRQCSNDRVGDALEATDAFGSWVMNDLFGSLDQDRTTLMIFPQSWGRPDYRSQGLEQPVLFKEFFSIYSFAYLVGCPDYTLPIGEVPFASAVTNTTEYLPVSISLVGRPGADLELFNIVERLHRKGIIRDVKAGSRMYNDDVVQMDIDSDSST